jgi:transglutaminase-like putative cysteine protease
MRHTIEQGGGRRLHIRHSTGYRYSGPVEASFNEVRMTPESREGQHLIAHSLHVVPNAAVSSYVDYWGAHVESFDVHEMHEQLEVVSESTVDTPATREIDKCASWDVVLGPDVHDRWGEYLVPTRYVDLPIDKDDRGALVTQLRREATPRDAALRVVDAVEQRLSYSPGATSVYTTAGEAWLARRGVCQDFTHATLSLLRSLQIPARYVSGYLHSVDEAAGQTVMGESHAWVEYWDGDWHSVDPTNNRVVGPAHVTVARGRDYADVPPLKGIYAGSTSEALGVVVEITQQ